MRISTNISHDNACFLSCTPFKGHLGAATWIFFHARFISMFSCATRNRHCQGQYRFPYPRRELAPEISPERVPSINRSPWSTCSSAKRLIFSCWVLLSQRLHARVCIYKLLTYWCLIIRPWYDSQGSRWLYFFHFSPVFSSTTWVASVVSPASHLQLNAH